VRFTNPTVATFVPDLGFQFRESSVLLQVFRRQVGVTLDHLGVGLIFVPKVPLETQCFSRAPRMPSSQVIDCG
jgi:hypothetical protein